MNFAKFVVGDSISYSGQPAEQRKKQNSPPPFFLVLFPRTNSITIIQIGRQKRKYIAEEKGEK